jgi:hypothetical protein
MYDVYAGPFGVYCTKLSSFLYISISVLLRVAYSIVEFLVSSDTVGQVQKVGHHSQSISTQLELVCNSCGTTVFLDWYVEGRLVCACPLSLMGHQRKRRAT